MARVVWPPEVIDQLDQIKAYIRTFDPVAADRVTDRLVTLGNSLQDFPLRGRPCADGSRELTTVPPYILSYDVVDDVALIVDVRHGRRQGRLPPK